MDLRQHIRQIPDFPKPGILFYDIATLLAHPQAWTTAIEQTAQAVSAFRPTKLAGIESRGFILAAPVAQQLGLGWMMIRKQGKLPGDTVPLEYQLEYGSDTIEVQKGAVAPGDRVVILDDLLATGGTLAASVALLRQCGAEVTGAVCIIELAFLKGRSRLDVPVSALVSYDS